MKLKLETIPVWDAFSSESECPLCLLMAASEQDAVSYYTGSSVMHPETRVQVNTKGFCPTHWSAVLEGGSAQSVALLSHTFLLETMKQTEKSLDSLSQPSRAKKLKKMAADFISTLKRRSTGCLVCDRMAERRERYLYTIIKLYFDDAEFREMFLGSKGFCLYHTQDLITMAQKMLKDKDYAVFIKDMAVVTQKNLERMASDVHWMTQKYKSEFADSPWNGCEDAHRRTVKTFTGSGRLYASQKEEG